MSRDIGIQWETLVDENVTQTADNTTGESNLHKEISSLKADIWSLKLSLADSLQMSNNLQVSNSPCYK